MRNVLKALMGRLAPQEPQILHIREYVVLLNARSDNAEELTRLCGRLADGTTAYSTDGVEYAVKKGTPTLRGALGAEDIGELKQRIQAAWLEWWYDKPPFSLSC